MEKIFESEHISFVKVNECLINEYLEMVNDMERVGQYIGKRRTPYSVEEEIAFVRGKLQAQAPIFSMIESSSGKFIGNIELMNVKDGCGELGAAITADMQDKGYGTEAVGRVNAYGFETLGLNRIFLNVYPNNERAIHVYEKCGFVKYDETETGIRMEVKVTKTGGF